MSKYRIEYDPLPVTNKYFKIYKKQWLTTGEYLGGFKTLDEAILHVDTLKRMDLYNKKRKDQQKFLS